MCTKRNARLQCIWQITIQHCEYMQQCHNSLRIATNEMTGRKGRKQKWHLFRKKGVENNRSNLVLKPIIRTFNEENHLWQQFIQFLAWSWSYYHITKLRNSTLHFIFNLFYHSNQNWHFDVLALIEWTSIFRSISHWRKWYFWRYNFLLVFQPRPEKFAFFNHK